ncbi:MAG: hypothetical protein GY851_03940, partial [bacterium]|nr:hypothetical protein [bacterium]
MKLTAIAAGGGAFLLAAVVVILEWNKGTIKIDCPFPDVAIRIMEGDEVHDTLTVTPGNDSVRVAAGKYVVEIDGEYDGLTVENNEVAVSRGGTHVVRIVQEVGRTPQLPHMTLEDVVEAFLQYEEQLESVEAVYSAVRRDVRTGQEHALEEGVFGIRDGKLAARDAFGHVVYDGITWWYAARGELPELQRAGTLFGHHSGTPVLAFNRMRDAKFTPMAEVLRDAVASQPSGKAELLPERLVVNGDSCYVIDGEYDLAELNDSSHLEPDLWRYHLFLNPRCGMRMVRVETWNINPGIPMGAVEVEAFRQYAGLWIPMRTVLQSYSYRTGPSPNGAERWWASEHTHDLVIELEHESVLVNQPPRDAKLFETDGLESNLERVFTNLGNGVGVPSNSIDEYAEEHGITREQARVRMRQEIDARRDSENPASSTKTAITIRGNSEVLGKLK